MDKTLLMTAVLDSMKNPVLVADTDHKVIYMNKPAESHYRQGRALLGTSLLDCHNEASQQMMFEILEALQAGETERMITDNEKYRIYMRAVRDAGGTLIGYYERYEPPVVKAAQAP